MTTILFLHGWGGNAQSFAPLSQYFSRAVDANGQPYQVLTPMLPCPPENVYTLDDYARDIKNYLDAHQVCRCVVVAHSFGARVVAVLNAQYPQMFEKIVITGGAGLPPRRSLRVWWRVRWYRLRKRLFGVTNGGSADYRGLSPNGKITFQNIIHRDLTPEIKQIKVPLLLIWGQKDRDTPLTMLRRWTRLVPHAQTIIYRGAGHFAYLDCAARFIKDVENFLRAGVNAPA